MRDYKDNIFYYESGEIADPLEKNTVHGLVKTLQDTRRTVTKQFVEQCLDESIDNSATYEYRTEVSAAETSATPDEKRVLIGLSRTGGVRDGGGAGSSPQIDARIRVKNQNGGRLCSIFIEAKTGNADLRRGQLDDYTDAFNISYPDTENKSWKTIQWSDVYRLFEDARSTSTGNSVPSRDEYLLSEFNHRLLQKEMVRGTLGVKRSGGEDGQKHRKRLLVGPKDPDSDPVLTFWAFSRRDDRNQSSSMEVPQECFNELFGNLDLDTRRKVFFEGDLEALRQWVLDNTGTSESEINTKSGCTFARASRAEYDDPAGIMLRFCRGDNFKINSYNVESDNGWIYYPPILVPHEWETVFQEMAEKLSEEQQERFIEDFDMKILWEAYLNDSRTEHVIMA